VALFNVKNRRKKYNTIYDYLEGFMSNLKRILVIYVVLVVVVFINRELVFDDILLAPKNPEFISNRTFCELGESTGIPDLCINPVNYQLYNFELSGQFSLHFMVSFIVALILIFPYIIWEIKRFVTRVFGVEAGKKLGGAVLISSGLMIVGAAFSYFIIVPLTINFLYFYEVSAGVENYISIRSYIGMVTTLVLIVGFTFQLPLLAHILGKMGFLTRSFLKKYRRHALVIVAIVAAIITPPDVFSQILVTIPLYGLYEVSILVLRKQKSNI